MKGATLGSETGWKVLVPGRLHIVALGETLTSWSHTHQHEVSNSRFQLYYATFARMKASWERLCSHNRSHTVSVRATHGLQSLANNVDEGSAVHINGFDILASVNFNDLVDMDFYLLLHRSVDLICCYPLQLHELGSLYSVEIFLWWSTKDEDLKGFPHSGVFPWSWTNLLSLIVMLLSSLSLHTLFFFQLLLWLIILLIIGCIVNEKIYWAKVTDTT